MGFNLGDILVKVKWATEGAKEAMGSVSDIKDTTEDTAESTNSLGDNLRGFANKAAIGLGVIGAGLTIFAKSATDTAVEFAKGSMKLARETGVTVTEASRLQFVAQRMGLTVDEASMAFGKLSKQIVATNEATVPGTTALSQLNIATKNADGSTRGFNDVLFDLADKFKGMPDGIEKSNLAMDIFGRSGRDLIPLLNQGRDGIAELQKKADELGITLSGDNITKFQEYVTAQKDLADSSLALKMAIGEKTTPVMTEFNKKLNELLTKALELPGPLKDVAVGLLAFGGPAASAASAALGTAANIATITSEMKGLGKYAKMTLAITLIGAEVALLIAKITDEYKKLEDENKKAADSSKASWEAIERLNQKIKEMPAGEARDKLIALRDAQIESQAAIDANAHGYDSFKGFLDALVNESIPGFVEALMNPIAALGWFNEAIKLMTGIDVGSFFQGIWESITTWLGGAWTNATTFVTNIYNDVVNWFGRLPGVVGGFFAGIWNSITSWLANAWSSATSWVSNIVNSVVNWFGQLPGRVGSFLSNMVGQIGAWFGNAWNTASSWASRIVNGIVDWFSQLPGRIAGAVGGIAGALAGALRGAAQAAKNALPGPIQSALSAIGFADGGLVKYLAGGGLGSIFKPMGTDTIPAMLSPGEFVIQASAVKNVGIDLLNAINTGDFSKIGGRGGTAGTQVNYEQNFYPRELRPADIELANASGWFDIGQRLKVGS